MEIKNLPKSFSSGFDGNVNISLVTFSHLLKVHVQVQVDVQVQFQVQVKLKVQFEVQGPGRYLSSDLPGGRVEGVESSARDGVNKLVIDEQLDRQRF